MNGYRGKNNNFVFIQNKTNIFLNKTSTNPNLYRNDVLCSVKVILCARCSGTHPKSLGIFQSKAMFSPQKNISAQNTLTITSQEQSNCPKISITSLATPRGTMRNCFYSCDCFRLPLIGPQGKVTTFTNNSTHSVHSESCHLLKRVTYRPHNCVYADLALDNQQLRTVLGAIAKLRKATNSFIVSVRPSVRPSVRMKQLGSHWTNFHEN
jgi:hypothetical protein